MKALDVPAPALNINFSNASMKATSNRALTSRSPAASKLSSASESLLKFSSFPKACHEPTPSTSSVVDVGLAARAFTAAGTGKQEQLSKVDSTPIQNHPIKLLTLKTSTQR